MSIRSLQKKSELNEFEVFEMIGNSRRFQLISSQNVEVCLILFLFFAQKHLRWTRHNFLLSSYSRSRNNKDCEEEKTLTFVIERKRSHKRNSELHCHCEFRCVIQIICHRQ